ncbi:MAG: YdcF family protein [Tannerella sp.]|jgi:uncharacterized SAM-binding protein YcdF (DUF218 family)|nr:YdcF family protein [Tannerella sp.]
MKVNGKKLGILTGTIFIAGALISATIYGFTIGYSIPIIIGLLLIAISLWFKKLPRKWRKIVSTLIIIGISFFLVVTGVVVVRGTKNTVDYTEDCAIVLGSGIRGETVLPTMQNRLDACLEYHRKNEQAIIIVSGGQGPNEAISEAEAMKRYLINHGIPASQIIKEDRSHNTKENFSYSKKILEQRFAGRPYSVACITSHYHISRAEKIAFKQDIDVRTYSADVDWHLLPFAYIREFLSILKYWILG